MSMPQDTVSTDCLPVQDEFSWIGFTKMFAVQCTIILLQDRPSSASAAQCTKARDAQSNIEKLFIVFFCRKHLSFVYILQEDDGTPIGSKECDVLFTGM